MENYWLELHASQGTNKTYMLGHAIHKQLLSPVHASMFIYFHVMTFLKRREKYLLSSFSLIHAPCISSSVI